MRRLLLALFASAVSGFLVPASLPARCCGTSLHLSALPAARHTHAAMNVPVGRGVDGQPRRKGEPPACV